MKIRIYAYGNCSTCRKALRFLEERGHRPEVLPIREQPPTIRELATMLTFVGGDIRKLFNTSGETYRVLRIKERLPHLSTRETLTLLASHGNLVKRPFVLTRRGGLVGFNPREWESALS